MARTVFGATRAPGIGAVLVGVAALAASIARADGTMLSHGRFAGVSISRPEGAKRGVAIVLYGHRERAIVASVQQALAARGAFVIAAPIEPLIASLEGDPAACVFPDGDVENLSHFAQANAKLPSYSAPVLVAAPSASALAYALLAQAPEETFAGGIGVDFCPHLPLRKVLCPGAGLRTASRRDGRGVDLRPALAAVPWTTVATSAPPPCDAATRSEFEAAASAPGGAEAGDGWIAKLGAAWADLAARASPVLVPLPVEVSDLPVVEVEARGTSELAAVLLSGDGGWAGIDRQLAASFAAAGLPVVGLDSLRYFWTPRTPESAAADVDRLLRFALARGKKARVLLAGYSQGADVLPFVANRLPETTRERIALVAMLGLGRRAEFEFHLSSWIVTSGRGAPIAPELARMTPGLGLCLYGSDDQDSGCLDADPERVRVVRIPGGHHFGGDYDRLAKAILEAAAERSAAGPSR